MGVPVDHNFRHRKVAVGGRAVGQAPQVRSAPIARGFDSRMCLRDLCGILHIRIRVLYLLNRSFHAVSRRTVLPGSSRCYDIRDLSCRYTRYSIEIGQNPRYCHCDHCAIFLRFSAQICAKRIVRIYTLTSNKTVFSEPNVTGLGI